MVNKSNETIVYVSIVILGIVLFAIITGIALKNKDEVRIGEKEIGLLQEISGISSTFENWLSHGESDAIFLSNDEDIRYYSETSDISYLTTGSTELFLAYAKAKKNIYQIEYINEKGQEMIRIYYDPSISDYAAMPREQLPDLSNVSYFKKTMELDTGKIYVSDIHPANSSTYGVSDEVIITYSTPVINSTGLRKGIVVVSLRVETIINNLNKALLGEEYDEEYFIVDQDGYYIYNSKNRAKEFGQYTGTEENLKKDSNFAKIMLSGADGKSLDIRNGLTEYHTYHYNPSNLSQYIVIIGVNKFALIYQMLLDGIVLVIGLLSYFILIYAYRNFIKGDFKTLLRSMILIITLFSIYKTLEISESYFEEIENIFIVEQTALILSLLMIVVFAYQLIEFSNMYGFADKKAFKK